jgi:hypothetical protein
LLITMLRLEMVKNTRYITSQDYGYGLGMYYIKVTFGKSQP